MNSRANPNRGRRPAPAEKSPRAPATERILAVLKSIPKGKVAAYGQVAALAGLPNGARQVARVLHSLSGGEKLPWHRVIGASGRISLPGADGAEQARRLAREGVKVDTGGRVDWDRFRWRPHSISAA
jgi:methylated-DNA-protein-cysteine methyltransferase-like protein